jgi:hypothetical protein
MEEALMSLAVLAKKPFVLPSSLSSVERLVGAIDDLMRDSGKDPDDSAAAIAVLVGDLWGPELWTKTAVSIGLPPPDDETRAHVVRTYIRRGRARRAVSGDS